MDGVDEFTCLCATGFNASDCSIDIDECALGVSLSTTPLCLNNGTCVDQPGDYICACLPGFMGPDCSVDINECTLAGAGACANGGICVDLINNYACACAPGFS